MTEQIKSYYANHRQEMIPFLPPRYTKVLEIGCGTGRFIATLDPAAEYWGIEPSREAAAIAAQKAFRVLPGTYDQVSAELPDNYFDLVICNDVIEHMPDHDGFFSAIKQKMRPGAFISGSVPNVRYVQNLLRLLIQRDWAYGEEGILDRTHLRFFTQKSLRITFVVHQFEIEKINGVNPLTLNFSSIKNFIKSCFQLTCVAILGGDAKYLQIAFRIKKG